MGGVCCVAGRDKAIVNGSSSDILHRNIRYSPAWSFRWDNRGRVAGEDTSITCFSDGISRNEIIPASDQSISRNISMDKSLEQVKESTEFPAVSNPLPGKLSLSSPSTSSLSMSPSSQNHFQSASSVMPRETHHSSTGQLPEQASVTQISGFRSSNSFSVHEERSRAPSWSNESTRESHGGSPDGWSMHVFSELTASSRKEKCLFDFDNESSTFSHGKSKCQVSASSSVDLQTCGICTKLLTEKSFWSSQKLVATNELSVVAILICGHVYHAECLETMTCELDKYDPSCPICTLGEKQTLKLCQKALKAEMDLKAKNKRSRKRIVDSDFDGVSYMLDTRKAGGHERKGPKMASSSSMKSSSAKPFLRRHFSFGGKGNKSSTDDYSTRKKGFFWTRSLKV